MKSADYIESIVLYTCFAYLVFTQIVCFGFVYHNIVIMVFGGAFLLWALIKAGRSIKDLWLNL